MELRDFIATTLTEIQTGVQAAIDAAVKSGTKGAINPCWGEPTGQHVQNVQFDIAGTVSDKSSGNASAGIKVVGISIGGDGSKEKETSHVSRIQFSISVIPPVSTIT
jgi:hypothetical protein